MRAVALSVGVVLGLSAPAYALSVDPSDPSSSPRTAVEDRAGIDGTPQLHPWLAATLSVVPALGLAAIANIAPTGSPLKALAFAAPFTFGLGDLYAGAGLRAATVTLGGPLAMLGGAGVGALAGGLTQGFNGSLLGPIAVGGWSAATAYGAWAAADAYHEAERRNQHDAPGQRSLGGL